MRLAHLPIVAALVSATLLSGCIGAGEPLQGGVVDPTAVASPLPGSTAPVNLTELAQTGFEAPEWAVGHAWTIDLFGPGENGPCQLVVTSADGPYVLAPTCDALAQNDAVFDMSYVGPISSEHLAGAQRGTPVRFFDFPLTDGKTWTTTWDGLDVTLTATFAPTIAAPGAGSGPGFTIVGTTADGETYVTYDYAPALKWWTKIEFVEGYGMRVTKFEEGWKGTYKAAAANLVYTPMSPAAGFFAPSSFTVAEGQTSLLLLVMGQVSGHTVAMDLLGPDGMSQYQTVMSGESGAYFEMTTLPALPGEWRAATVGSYNPTDGGGISIELHEVAVTEQTLA